MTGRDEKHCGRLTDHDPHDWRGHGQSTVVTSSPAEHIWSYGVGRWIGPDYRCPGQIVVEGGHW